MPQLALSDFENRVWGRLDNNQQLYPQPQVDLMINEGVRVTNLMTGFNQAKVANGLTVAGWMWYTVPSPIIFATSVYLDNKQLDKSPADSTSNGWPKWLRGSTGRRSRMWVPLGISMYAVINPDPNGGQYMEVWGVATPALLVNPTDQITLDDDYANLIEDYCAINLPIKEGGKPFADAAKGQQAWWKRARELQRWEGKTNPRFWVEAQKRTEADQ